MYKKILAVLCGIGAVLSLSLTSAPAAEAASSCSTRNGTITYNAFIGHNVNVGYTTCWGKTSLTSSKVKAVYFSDTLPFGGGEVLKVTTSPWKYSTTQWRFTIYQTVIFDGFPAGQTWNFKAQFRASDGKGRICFITGGGACSSYQ